MKESVNRWVAISGFAALLSVLLVESVGLSGSYRHSFDREFPSRGSDAMKSLLVRPQ
jgi:hypothetical protein